MVLELRLSDRVRPGDNIAVIGIMQIANQSSSVYLTECIFFSFVTFTIASIVRHALAAITDTRAADAVLGKTVSTGPSHPP